MRDSKNFDELKAKSAPRSSKGRELPHPLVPKEAVEDDYDANASISVVRGQHLRSFSGCLTEAVAENSSQNQKLTHSELDFKFRATHAETTKSPREFWPEYAFQPERRYHANSNSREIENLLERCDVSEDRLGIAFAANRGIVREK